VLLAFYDFPAEHWHPAHNQSPGTVCTKGSLSPTTAKLMVFKLVIADQTPGGG
jgi:putative transposase